MKNPDGENALDARPVRGHVSRTLGGLLALQGMAGNRAVQRLLVGADSVAGDLMWEGDIVKPTLFKSVPKAYSDIVRTPSRNLVKSKKATLTDKINQKREVDYADLGGSALTFSDLDGMVGSSQEQMYVHGADIYHETRDASIKLPHPTLIGGDPAVTCAGELHVTKSRNQYTVEVTTESGHYKPRSVPDETVEAVKKQVEPPPATDKDGFTNPNPLTVRVAKRSGR